ncbi:dual serine/threonine and tyrosine protein kinase-like isoform X2 [Triplophysa rosa]|uniref:dual serine/threonine and tyrosine protein kinase-like isoform X2 n=1 Tax=Triplophysa rosa TaxID=992332 RepID=UPI002545DA26|nr:dual serine/threonine and tyrosine protein kinase-like isoform X2 [Triplophysa rosa]
MERLHRYLYTGLKAGLMLKARLQIALNVVEGIRSGSDSPDKQITDLGFCKPEAMVSGSIVGTPIHMAPELFTGISAPALSNSQKPLRNVLVKISCGPTSRKVRARSVCPCLNDEEWWQLMEACWNGDPSQRPLLGIVQPGLQRSCGGKACYSCTKENGRIRRLCDRP